MVALAHKISIYVDEELHRSLKSMASLEGISLSEFVARAARRALHAPDRRTAAAEMDRIRHSLRGTFSLEDLRAMREEGRRF